MADLKNESYWRDPDGKVNDAGHELAEVYKKSLQGTTFVNKPNPEGYCTTCYDPGKKVARKLQSIGEVNRSLIKVCGVCDGDALTISRNNST